MGRISHLQVVGTFREDFPGAALQIVGLIRKMGGVIDYCDHKIVGIREKGDAEGPEQAEFVVEGNSFDTARKLLHRGELQSLYCMLPSDGVERFFVIEPRPDGVEITLLGNQKRMPDGSMDFNWQYNYWLPVLHTILVVEGVKFSEFY